MQIGRNEEFASPSKTYMEAICAAIRARRLALGYTQEYMAYKLNISQNAYHKLETSKCALKVETLIQLAKVLDVTVVFFFEPKSSIEKA